MKNEVNRAFVAKKKVFFIAAVAALFIGCQTKPITSIECKSIAIDSSMDAIADTAYSQFLQPIIEQLDAQIGQVIAYAPQPLTKGQPECTILNWASDALLAKARQYYPGTVDIAIVNIGSMRTEWAAGDITLRHIYELMPFDNRMVILTLKGEDILELSQIFVVDGGQGIANMTIIGEDKQLAEARIGGQPIDPEAYYHVATSDYLSGGTDHMVPLTRHIEMWNSGLIIRDLYIEYAKEQKTIVATLDGRTQIN